MPATQAMEIAVVIESHTRAGRERLAREEANAPYFSRPRDSLRSTLAILKWRYLYNENKTIFCRSFALR